MKITVFLQNAWSPFYAGRTWERESWLRALKRSHSGLRLKNLIDDFNLCENTTPMVGATSDSILPPDEAHIRKVLETRRPDVVVACGKQAEQSLLRLWEKPLLAVPHPSHRFLTNGLYLEARNLLEQGFAARLALRQIKGGITREVLPALQSEFIRG